MQGPCLCFATDSGPSLGLFLDVWLLALCLGDHSALLLPLFLCPSRSQMVLVVVLVSPPSPLSSSQGVVLANSPLAWLSRGQGWFSHILRVSSRVPTPSGSALLRCQVRCRCRGEGQFPLPLQVAGSRGEGISPSPSPPYSRREDCIHSFKKEKKKGKALQWPDV